MRFVHDDEIFFRISVELVGAGCEEIKQTVGALPWRSPVKMQRIVLDGLTVTDLSEHLKVVFGFLFQTIPFQFLSLAGEPL